MTRINPRVIDCLFNTPEQFDPCVDMLPEHCMSLNPAMVLESLNGFFQSSAWIKRYSSHQLAHGLQLITDTACSDYPLLYTTRHPDSRLLRPLQHEAIRCLTYVYSNIFEPYCTDTYEADVHASVDPLAHICYMFWDIFALHPDSTDAKGVVLALEVMERALHSGHYSCIRSALHGLGHWHVASNGAAGGTDAPIIAYTQSKLITPRS
ncbi:hypothetical protein HMY34_13435 [Thiothrix subterranea]|uniref:hypothetical protein n=1 Tax=Thiothrix subterranea TaxID=2735563 RepID=UPI00192C4D66|nr:hypothetical protein [Thiothrix subterranea]QQZ29693.1 hypothetical protein HMY34_13435 [Thiothrix subterranea]